MYKNSMVPTPDNMLERQRQDPDVLSQTQLIDDFNRPAVPASEPRMEHIPQDHPMTDAEIDSSDVYEHGITGSTDFGSSAAPRHYGVIEYEED